MSEMERTRPRGDVSRIETKGRPSRRRMPADPSGAQSLRLKMEAEEARHRRRREEAEAAQRFWKERLVTRAVVFAALGLCVFCAAVMLSGAYTPPEAKEWAITTLKYGATALAGYMGCALQKTGAQSPKGDGL